MRDKLRKPVNFGIYNRMTRQFQTLIITWNYIPKTFMATSSYIRVSFKSYEEKKNADNVF